MQPSGLKQNNLFIARPNTEFPIIKEECTGLLFYGTVRLL